FTPEPFQYAFTNTLSEEESARVYERYHIPAPGSWVWGGVLANSTPGHQATWVDDDNHDRAPLLFIAGGADTIMPAGMNRTNAKKYEKSSPPMGHRERPDCAGCSRVDRMKGWTPHPVHAGEFFRSATPSGHPFVRVLPPA
ncbi:MAG TPA: hypothetical protein VH723_01610, partial [Candidatus Limnocylindrales bacterium]